MIACPPDEELLPLADAESGVEAEASVRIHVASCPSCKQRQAKLSSELRALRNTFFTTQSVILRGAPQAKPASSPMPATIGKYVIISTLGTGGQATVYRAAHPSLAREVVIKLARKSIKSGDVDLLAAEGKILADLDHPNIARVYDLDIHEGLPYLVMQHIRGQTLENFTYGRPASAANSAAILAPIARAVAYAHSRGVGHQDISPRNIIVSDNNKLVLIDFGLAKLQNFSDGIPTGGTPGYMAPEQARNEPNRVEALSDVFSLGAILHYLITGRSPYRAGGNSLEAAKTADLDIAKLPPALDGIVRKCVAVSPAERYPTAAALADALEAAAKTHPHRKLFTIAAIAAAAAIAIFAWIGLHPDPIQAPSSTPAPVAATFPSEAQQVLIVTGYKTPADAIPLRAGDRVRAEVRIAHSANSAAFWIAGTSIQELPTAVAKEETFNLVSAPGLGKDAPLESPKGPEAVVIVASLTALKTPEEREIFRQKLQELLRKSPPAGDMPSDCYVTFGPWGMTQNRATAADQRPIDLNRVQPLSWLDAAGPLHAALAELKTQERIDYFAGCMFPTKGDK